MSERRRLRHRVSSSSVIADTTALITLARIGRLGLLPELFTAVVIPQAVHQELALAPRGAKVHHRGDEALRLALEAGWIIVHKVRSRALVAELMHRIGDGEAEAITLALECGASTILLDDELARAVAIERGLGPRRTADLFVQAKARGLVDSVHRLLGECERSGCRFADEVAIAALRVAGEEACAGAHEPYGPNARGR